jgi:hypothetical protein
LGGDAVDSAVDDADDGDDDATGNLRNGHNGNHFSFGRGESLRLADYRNISKPSLARIVHQPVAALMVGAAELSA